MEAPAVTLERSSCSTRSDHSGSRSSRGGGTFAGFAMGAWCQGFGQVGSEPTKGGQKVVVADLGHQTDLHCIKVRFMKLAYHGGSLRGSSATHRAVEPFASTLTTQL